MLSSLASAKCSGLLTGKRKVGVGHPQLTAVIFSVLCPSQRMLSGRAAKITAVTYYREIVHTRSRRPFNTENNR